MDCFATGKAVDGSGGVRAGEDDERVTGLVVQVGRVDRDSEVVTPEADPDVGGSGLMAELVVVPKGLGIGQVLFADLGHQSGIRKV